MGNLMGIGLCELIVGNWLCIGLCGTKLDVELSHAID
jgi:hypothetical protein